MDRLQFTEADSHSSYAQVRQPSQLDPSFYADRATLLLGSYRNDKAANPEIYVQAIAMVLSEYPSAVAEYATDPRTGMPADQRYQKVPPNAGEVKSFCDAEMRRIRRDAMPPRMGRRFSYVPPRTDPGCRAQSWIHPDAPQYARAEKVVQGRDVDPRDWKYEEIDGRKWIGLSYGLYLAMKGQA